MFWRFVILAALCVGNYGCANIWMPYSNDPFVRMDQTMIDSENTRQPVELRRPGWLHDCPAELTPYRVHGGVGPAASAF